MTGATGYLLVCRLCDSTSGNLNKTSVRENSGGVYLAIVLRVSELFDDILFILNVGRDYAGLRVDLSLLRKCVIVWFPDWLTGRTQVCGRVVGLLHQNILCQP